MRLTCPNCDAHYEVAEEAVPTDGRDVQCSNCGKTWFQYHPDFPGGEDEADFELGPIAPAPDDEVSPAQPADLDDEPGPKRRQLDPAVADILRAEAEIEFEARRRRQAETLESQPDLGLVTGEQSNPPTPPVVDKAEQRRAEDAKQRTARMRGEPEVSPELAAAAVSSRRELLPDIEEINSTLRNDSAPTSVDATVREEIGAGGEHKRKRKGGFRRGFLTILLLFVIFLLIYVYADKIAEAVPAVKYNLATYVEWVDQLRLWLDVQLKSVLGTLDTMAKESDS